MKGHSRIDSSRQTSSRRYNLLLVLLLLPATIIIVFSPFYLQYLHLNCNESNTNGILLSNINHKSTSQEDQKDRILVVYAGPSSKQAKKVALYEKNLEFFK